jgi:predicted transcriptional regulator
MAMRVTVTLSEDTYRRAQRLAQMTRQSVADVLSDTLDVSLPTLPTITDRQPPITTLKDAEVLAYADLQLSGAQDQRISELLERQQDGLLNETERSELATLMQVYYQSQLHKAQGLEEAVRRGLRESPAP